MTDVLKSAMGRISKFMAATEESATAGRVDEIPPLMQAIKAETESMKLEAIKHVHGANQNDWHLDKNVVALCDAPKSDPGAWRIYIQSIHQLQRLVKALEGNVKSGNMIMVMAHAFTIQAVADNLGFATFMASGNKMMDAAKIQALFERVLGVQVGEAKA